MPRASIQLNSLVRVPLEIPTGTVARVRKNRMDARLHVRFLEAVLDPLILQMIGIPAVDFHFSERIASNSQDQPIRSPQDGGQQSTDDQPAP